jgi:hypothetical protein
MSDEFNTPNRSFEPGEDHMWTSLEKPDGVNAALEVYSHNMTSTACNDNDTCYFYIEAMEDEINITVWNSYTDPPGYQDLNFYYRGGMVQSWNKFCYQGGMIDVRVQLPGAVSAASGNPDISNGLSYPASTIKYYPVWPGIWMMGNLGRAIFTASTARIWPFTYNECNDTVFDSQNQRISACNDNPGHGLNANQGRGAPEIDILEGGGTDISSSIQIGPGMPEDFRRITDNTSYSCMYTYTCTTEGANNADVPTTYYESLRGYQSWYQGLRYAANNVCDSDSSLVQAYNTIASSLEEGITDNACTLAICPASFDVHSDLGLIDGSSTEHWGVNTNGTCFPKINAYTGAFLCSPGNTDAGCEEAGSTDEGSEFAYQMDAISSNWPIHVGGYTSWVGYQLEWVAGDDGYVRWMLEGSPIFEVPADALTNPPQDAGQMNPRKIMIEEPMYLIFNLALSSTWGATPPNARGACRGDGSDATTNAICDEFPMYLKIDYIRLYQDTSTGSNMSVGCDPSTHPTAQWIEDHIDSYVDTDNPWEEVSGMAFCSSDDDCTISTGSGVAVVTGSCVDSRCKCKGSSWKGPRCTIAGLTSDSTSLSSSYGPPMYASIAVSGVTLLVTFLSVLYSVRSTRKGDEGLRRKMLLQQQQEHLKAAGALSIASEGKNPRDEYSTNFV